MDQDYQPFCAADPSSCDAMRSEGTAGASFATTVRLLPDGWTLHEQDDWFVVIPQVRQEILPTRPRQSARRVRGPHPVGRHPVVPATPEPPVMPRHHAWTCLYITDFDEDSRQSC